MNYKQMTWDSWHHRFGLAGEGQADVIQNVLEQDRGLVLNIGCGLDRAKLGRLAAHCDALIALDKSHGMVQRAHTDGAVGSVAFLVADAHYLPFADGLVDHVVALGLFAHIGNTAAVLREFRRVCRQGGHIMITNSVSRPLEHYRQAGLDAGLEVVREAEGYCPAASGDIKRRYLLVFSSP